MKKLMAILLSAIMVVSMAACGGKTDTTTTPDNSGSTSTPSTNKDGGFELALITDVGTIDDKSFNQGSWEGLEKYAKENNITHKYYKPTEKSDTACLQAIDLAVKGGAKLIVTPGFLFEIPIYEAQTKYPDVKFIILDGAPHKTDDFTPVIADNTLSIFYAEEQAGFLAGYAAVIDGHKKLGFMGGLAVPAVVRFGHGFIQGVDYAAKELGLKKGEVEVKYTYTGNFDATPETQSKAASWYKDGTEVIFACGGAVGNSVMKAAETAGKKVIGVDVDQSSESSTVMTSAMKNLSKSVYDAIGEFYKGSFQGGKSVILDAKVDGIELPMATSKFTTFNQEKYDAIYKGFIDGTVNVSNELYDNDCTKVPTEIVKVTSIA